jgi:hypothetical protein
MPYGMRVPFCWYLFYKYLIPDGIGEKTKRGNTEEEGDLTQLLRSQSSETQR